MSDKCNGPECNGDCDSCDSNPIKSILGGRGGVGIPVSLGALLSGLAGRKSVEKENLGVLDVDDVRSWNELNKESDDLKRKIDILSDKQTLFWAQIALKYNASGRKGMEIDETTGMLTAYKKEK